MRLGQPPITASDLPPTGVSPGITREAAAEASLRRRMCSIGSPISLEVQAAAGPRRMGFIGGPKGERGGGGKGI